MSTIQIAADKPVAVPADGPQTLLNDGPGDVFYKSDQLVSGTRHDGVLLVGESADVSPPIWLLASGPGASVEVSPAPPETVGSGSAAQTSFTPTTTIPETDVQDAIENLDARVVREAVNVLSHGADATNVTDATAAFQAAITKAKTAIGSSGPGEVFVPKGGYKLNLTDTLDCEGIILRGEGMEASKLFVNGDLGIGKQALSFQMSEVATVPNVGGRDLYLRGPSGSSALGNFPALMDGMRLGNAGYAENCEISGFRSGLNIFKDHERARGLRLGGNAFGILHDRTESGGDQSYEDITCSGCLIAAVAVHPDSDIGGARFAKCQFGFVPVSFLKLSLNSTAGQHEAAGTGDLTSGSNIITNVNTTLGAFAVGQRLVCTDGGTPTVSTASDGKGPGFRIEAINADGANTIRLSGNVTATIPGGHLYATAYQGLLVSASHVESTSFESWGNNLMRGDDSGAVFSNGMTFVACVASNPGAGNRQIAGWDKTGTTAKVGLTDWTLIASQSILKAMDSGVFDGGGLRNDYGETKTTIDAANTAGKPLVKVPGGTNTGGSRGLYNGDRYDVFQTSGATTIVKGHVMHVEDIRAGIADGTKPLRGVALSPVYVANDQIPIVARSSQPVPVKVDASVANGAIAANQYIKLDTAHPGCVVQAAGPTDGQVVGKTTATNAGGFVSALISIV